MKTLKPVLIAAFLCAMCSQLPAQDLRGLLNQVTRQASQQMRSSTPSNRQTANLSVNTNGSRSSRHHGVSWKEILPVIRDGRHWGGGGGWVPPPPPPNPSPRWVFCVYYLNCHHHWVYYGKYRSQWAADNVVNNLQNHGYRTYVKHKQEGIYLPLNR